MLSFLLLYIDKKDPYGLSISQRFSELYYFEFLKSNIIHDNQKEDLKFVIDFLMQIIKKINEEIYLLLEDQCDGNPTFALTWIVSYFGYVFDNIFYQYRLLDYFLCSHPLSIYILSGYLIVNEIQNYQKNNEGKVYFFLKIIN